MHEHTTSPEYPMAVHQEWLGGDGVRQCMLWARSAANGMRWWGHGRTGTWVSVGREMGPLCGRIQTLLEGTMVAQAKPRRIQVQAELYHHHCEMPAREVAPLRYVYTCWQHPPMFYGGGLAFRREHDSHEVMRLDNENDRLLIFRDLSLAVGRVRCWSADPSHGMLLITGTIQNEETTQ